MIDDTEQHDSLPDAPLTDVTLKRTVRLLQEPVTFDTEFEARVMRAVRAEADASAHAPAAHAPAGGAASAGHALQRAGNTGDEPWWTRSFTVQLRLPHLMAMAAAVVLMLTGVPAWRNTAAVESDAIRRAVAARAAGTPGRTLVRFAVQVPDAQRVAIVGDFNAWDPSATPLEWDARNGVWSVFVPLSPGKHEYMFVVNGTQWFADPLAVAHRDEFGEASSVVRIPESAPTRTDATS